MKIKFQQFDCQNSDKDKEAWIKIPVNLHIRCNQYSIHNKVRSPTLSQNRRCDFRRRTLIIILKFINSVQTACLQE